MGGFAPATFRSHGAATALWNALPMNISSLWDWYATKDILPNNKYYFDSFPLQTCFFAT
jgi:hypothetical protein